MTVCHLLPGKGEFGEVFLAKAKGIDPHHEAEVLVLVKSLQTRDEQLQLDFRREFEMFGKLNHGNVVRLLGLCREAEPHYMILEYVDLVRISFGPPCWCFGGGRGRIWAVLLLGDCTLSAACRTRGVCVCGPYRCQEDAVKTG